MKMKLLGLYYCLVTNTQKGKLHAICLFKRPSSIPFELKKVCYYPDAASWNNCNHLKVQRNALEISVLKEKSLVLLRS